MINRYETRGDVTIIFLERTDGTTLETMVSTRQLDFLKSLSNKWWASMNNSTKSYYVIGKILDDEGKKKQVSLHRVLAGNPSGMEVDHINHNTLDNRDTNLRVITTAQNQQNRKGAPSNSTSGIRGVHWHKRVGKWEVQVKVNRKKITIGYYEDLQEAEKAAIEARKKHMPFSNEAS